MILLAAMLLCMGRAVADEVTIDNVTIPKSGKAAICISLNNPDNIYTAGQMALMLPSGITAVQDASGNPQVAKGDRFASTNHSIGASNMNDNELQFTVFSINSSAIAGEEGILFTVELVTDETFEVGSTFEGKLFDIEMTTTDGIRKLFNDLFFTITISEPVEDRVVLDETSTTLPASSNGSVDVRLNRTLRGGCWQTIVLPFNASAEQVQAAWGEDVRLAEFTAWSSEEDKDGNIVGLSLTFTSTSEIVANTPMLICTSADYTTATFDGVVVETEEEPAVQVGKKKAERGYFTGTYVAGGLVPENNLFLSGNHFYYSNGDVPIQGYRAYFELADVLTEAEGASVKMRLDIDGTPTGLEDPMRKPVTADKQIYDLAGRKVSLPRRGVYVVDGKKVVVK